MSDSDKTMILIFTLLIGTPLLVVVNAFCIMKVWMWFIVPTFDIEPIGLVSAYGIGVFVSLLTLRADGPDNDDKEWHRPIAIFLGGVFGRLLILLMAYIVISVWPL